MITVISVSPDKTFPATDYLIQSRGLETAHEETFLIELYHEVSGVGHIGLIEHEGNYYRPFACRHDLTAKNNPMEITVAFEDDTETSFPNVINISQIPLGYSFAKGKLKLEFLDQSIIILENCTKWKDSRSEGTKTRMYRALECVKLTEKEKALHNIITSNNLETPDPIQPENPE